MIEEQKKYDEPKIMRKFAGVTSLQFANRKKHLYGLILESLRLYHSDHSVDAKLWNNLCQIEVLYDKQLISQCSKLIDKTKALANQFGKHRILQEIITWEERLLVETIASEKTEQEIQTLYAENLRQNELSRNVTILRQLLNDTVKFFRKGGLLRSKEGIAELNKLMKHPLLQDEKKLKTYHEQYHFLSIWGMYHMLLSDWKKSYEFRKKHLDLIEEHPHHIEGFDAGRGLVRVLGLPQSRLAGAIHGFRTGPGNGGVIELLPLGIAGLFVRGGHHGFHIAYVHRDDVAEVRT